MLKFYFTFFLFYFSSLSAQEPLMATLVNIVSNETQEFKIINNKFSCTPYGIITLDKLYMNADVDSICRKSILHFYEKRKDLQYYVHKKLNIFQSYSLIFKDNKCIINVSGEKSLSEFLLEEGLALKKKGILNKEYNFYFYKAEETAKVLKKGLWADNISKVCASSMEVK